MSATAHGISQVLLALALAARQLGVGGCQLSYRYIVRQDRDRLLEGFEVVRRQQNRRWATMNSDGDPLVLSVDTTDQLREMRLRLCDRQGLAHGQKYDYNRSLAQGTSLVRGAACGEWAQRPRGDQDRSRAGRSPRQAELSRLRARALISSITAVFASAYAFISDQVRLVSLRLVSSYSRRSASSVRRWSRRSR